MCLEVKYKKQGTIDVVRGINKRRKSIMIYLEMKMTR